MHADDLGAGVHSPDDGWLDPNGVLQGFRRKARSLGARYVADRVTGIDCVGSAVTGVRLESGATLGAGAVINATGAWAKEICALVGMPLPVEPMRRFEHYFERVMWPALAHRFPAFEAVREKRVWSGLYDQNELDGNVILGNWPQRLENFYVAAGFSGHGLMHAPAAGRALAGLILDGGFHTPDLARCGYARVVENRPYPERGII